MKSKVGVAPQVATPLSEDNASDVSSRTPHKQGSLFSDEYL